MPQFNTLTRPAVCISAHTGGQFVMKSLGQLASTSRDYSDAGVQLKSVTI